MVCHKLKLSHKKSTNWFFDEISRQPDFNAPTRSEKSLSKATNNHPLLPLSSVTSRSNSESNFAIDVQHPTWSHTLKEGHSLCQLAWLIKIMLLIGPCMIKFFGLLSVLLVWSLKLCSPSPVKPTPINQPTSSPTDWTSKDSALLNYPKPR